MDVAHCRINLYYQGVDAANADPAHLNFPRAAKHTWNFGERDQRFGL